MIQLINKNSRIEVVDALRGFAVMAIILVHNLEHFIFPVYPADSPNWLNILDQGVFNGIFTLFFPRYRNIFSPAFHQIQTSVTIPKDSHPVSVRQFLAKIKIHKLSTL